MHELQALFATERGEREWEAALRGAFEDGNLSGVRAVLEPSLAMLDSEFGRLALDADREGVALDGWEELVETLRQNEGDPITGIALAVANEADRAFEKGQTHKPFMMLGLYCDEPFAFSRASAAELVAQTRAEDGPAWAGHDEDIEVYLDLDGLDRLNTALLFHKQRHFFRDDNPAEAPLRYVEYVLGCWWRALLFHEAVAAECADKPLPGRVPVVAGMVDMRPEVVMVHGMGTAASAAAAPGEMAADEAAPQTPPEPPRPEIKPAAPILAADFIQVKTVEEVKEVTGADLRRRVVETGQEDEAPPAPRGFLARLFGRRASR